MSKLRTIFGQPSWRVASPEIELFVTQRGGHLGPATFRLGRKRVQPFHVAPWHSEKKSGQPKILEVLRGDFFCLPFGANDTPFGTEQHPPHGETANATWQFVRQIPGHVHLQLQTKVRSARVDKRIWLLSGHHAIYQQHTISGLSGPMNFGHHAMLRFPDEERSGLIATSGFSYGQVRPEIFERPAHGGYQSLRTGATFQSLRRVPSREGGYADLSAFPARRGYEDLVMLVGARKRDYAWTAVSFPREGYVWFALKDPAVLPHTLLWHSNGGRHYPPWNGRHINVLGLEEVVSYFDCGIAASASPNSITNRSHPTVRAFDPTQPCAVNYIIALARIPSGFDHVRSIVPSVGGSGVRLISRSGCETHAPLDLTFLRRRPAP